MSPLVSVVIPTFNRAEFLGAAIESALSQTWPEIEVIVVDDGSTDNTGEVLAGFGDRIRAVCQKNQDVAAARNTGVAMARGEFLAFLDSDDIWLPTKIERQMQCFLAQPEIGLVHCGVLDVDSDLNPVLSRLDGMEGWVAEEMLLFRRAVILGGGSAAIVTKAAFDAVGGFDVKLPPFEDWDLYYRIAQRFKVGFVPELLVNYRLHNSNSHTNIARMERGMMGAYKKAFNDKNSEVSHLRRRSYGKVHMVLAGSYFKSGKMYHFARHLSKSLLLTPENCTYALNFPRRYRQRFMK